MIDAKRLNEVRPSLPIHFELRRDFRFVIVLSLLHVPLGILLYQAGSAAIIHPLGAFAVGMYWAIQKQAKLHRVTLAVGYLVGAEVLWRMAQVPVFWEFGKYGAVAICVVALVRRGRTVIPRLPLIYFVALVPACFVTLGKTDWANAQADFSTHMSGPLLISVAAWYFSNVSVSAAQARQIFCALVIPLVSVASATVFYTVTAEEILFGTEGNLITSGGFGPNQVSAALGLGALSALVSLLIFKNSNGYKAFFIIVALFFAAQSVMTFSRGGMYNAVGAIGVVILIGQKDLVTAAKRAGLLAAIAMIFVLGIFPVLNNYTGGNLQARFEDTGTTKRADIAASDLEIFWENPVLGVGVGQAYAYRERLLDYKAMSHTELTRLISEHGIFGIIAGLILMGTLIANLRRNSTPLGRSIVAGAGTWAMLLMMNAGMRLAAPAFMVGLTFLTISLVTRKKREVPRSRRIERASRRPVAFRHA